MRRLYRLYYRIDIALTRWLARHAVLYLRLSLGLVFLWFGALKLIPGTSPAEELAGRTIQLLTVGLVKPDLSLPALAIWECLIGLGLLSGVWLRITLLLLVTQMAGTIAPLVLFPSETFQQFPVVPSLEGQYIIKNLVLISAALVIGATVRGGRLVSEPRSGN
jgi:uncharacterized membrane protein YphA (DoxX/SURF4 family)